MNRKDIDWSIIRNALIGVVLSLVISVSLVAGSFYFRDEMQKDFNMHNASFRAISQRYLAIDEEEKQIRKYYPKFIELYNQGVIGQEQRLNWIEVLRNTGSEINLPSLVYSINSQKKYTPAFKVNLGKFQLYASEMDLTLALLHEGDLFNLLERIRGEAKGIFSVNSCSFNSNGNILVDKPDATNINVNCSIFWYTIKLADGSALQIPVGS